MDDEVGRPIDTVSDNIYEVVSKTSKRTNDMNVRIDKTNVPINETSEHIDEMQTQMSRPTEEIPAQFNSWYDSLPHLLNQSTY